MQILIFLFLFLEHSHTMKNLLDIKLKDENPQEFFDNLSKHNWNNDFSLSNQINNKQLNKIAIHSFNLHKQKNKLY